VTRPVRIQLSRRARFDLQAVSRGINGLEAVSVARPHRWGNPFAPGREGPLGRQPIDLEGAVGFFRAMLDDPELRAAARYPADLSPLRGRNLACWCGPKDHCHADVLIEAANRD
jgi:hypothetical protein